MVVATVYVVVRDGWEWSTILAVFDSLDAADLFAVRRGARIEVHEVWDGSR